MFERVLIANRGEIAVRIARTLHAMGIAPVAVYATDDRASLHVRIAEAAHALDGVEIAETYLCIEQLVDVARRAGCQAVHPGYGFLSENAGFAEACENAGIAFIGPPVSAIRSMGEKTSARALMQEAGLAVVPGGAAESLEEARASLAEIGCPALIKPAAGGGGKGMRRVDSPQELEAAYTRSRSEAERFFGDARVYLERALDRPRHVEVQVLGDRHGNLIHLGARDCSLQRRHQKIVEEAPCPAFGPEGVAKLGERCVRAAASIGYESAGTFEFLLDANGEVYFLEMNTRLQVEHPVTELLTGVDLVEQMVRVAAGERLDLDSVTPRGAAVECRIYAEAPGRGFLPSPGTIDTLREPSGPGVRVDSGVCEGAEVSARYDPLLAKLCTWGRDRDQALRRMRQALSEYVITGVETNLSFHTALLRHTSFLAGDYSTQFVENAGPWLDEKLAADERHTLAAAAAAILELEAGRTARIQTADGARLPAWVAVHRADRLRRR